MNLVCVPLVSVIIIGAVRTVCLLDDRRDDRLELLVSGMLVESFLECLFIEVLKKMQFLQYSVTQYSAVMIEYLYAECYYFNTR